MKRIKQDVQLELLQEIDDICMQNGLTYCLFGENALNAYLNQTIKDGSRVVAIAMTQGDIDRFCDIVIKSGNKDRYVEGLFNNPRCNNFYVSYGNKNTTDFSAVRLNYLNNHGIRIRIYPIRKGATLEGDTITGWSSKLSKERKMRKYLNTRIESDELWFVKAGIATLNGGYTLLGGGKKYYNKIKKNTFIDKWEDIQNYSMVRVSEREVPSEFLVGVKKYDIDGYSLCLPDNTDAFFAEIFGEDFKEKIIKKRTQSLRTIVNTEVGFETVINENKELLTEIRSTYEQILWTRLKARKERETVKQVWNLVQMTKKQVEFVNYFAENKERIMAYDIEDEQQFLELSEELRPIIWQIRKYLRYGMAFTIDPETDLLIETVLAKQDCMDLIKKWKTTINKQYFVE